MANEKVEIKEYSYYVGNIEHTAMLTEKMAERLGAKPVGEASADDVANGGHTGSQNQARLGTTDMRAATDDGVTGETTAPYRGAGSEKQRTAKNKAQ